MKFISKKEQQKFVKSKGWHTWYNPNYWVNEKVIKDPTSQDYTNYGMDLASAYTHEKLKLGKVGIGYGFPTASLLANAAPYYKQIHKMLKTLEK